MITIKTKEEIEIIRKGGKRLAKILKELSDKVAPGITTGKLEKLACELIKKIGGRAAFKNLLIPGNKRFPTAICASINNEVVHAPALPSRELKKGDIIKIDIGMEYPYGIGKIGYYTDMAITVPVGEIDNKVQKLINATKKCLELGIDQIRAGNDLNDIGRAIQNYVESQGFSVVREMVGHGVGYNIHEEPQVPHFEVLDHSMKIITLKPGMVIAIEPMINTGDWRIKLSSDGYTYITKDGSLSAQFEHTVAVTEKGNIVLTSSR